jgi:hypothetical protein
MTAPYLPPGWPREVPPPGAPDWERRAVAWLFDQCPNDFRGYDVLRRHPLVLARFAADHLRAALGAARSGLGTVRAELRDVVAPDVVDAAVAAYEIEEQRVLRAQRAVELVDTALRGGPFTPKL